MAGDVEWIPGGSEAPAAVSGDRPDEIGSGTDRRWQLWWHRVGRPIQRVPRVARWAAAAAVAAALLAGLISTHPATHGTSNAPRSDGTTAGAPEIVLGLARDSRPLVDYVRSDSSPGACALVPIGSVPQRRLTAAVHNALPGYRISGVGRTLDQFTALCTLQLRAQNARGTTLVVQVAAAHPGDHNAFDHLSIASRTDGVTTVAVATDITGAGWTVTVGSVGPAADQPPSATLMQLAQDPALLW